MSKIIKFCVKHNCDKINLSPKIGGNKWICSVCKKEQDHKYYLNNSDKIKKQTKKYANDNKEKISDFQKEYRKNNKDKLASLHKEYNSLNKESISIYQKEYRKNNLDRLKKQAQNRYFNNKPEIQNYKKLYYIHNLNRIQIYKRNYYLCNKKDLLKISSIRKKEREKIDPIYRMRNYISGSIRQALKSNNSIKNGNSVLNFLPYTILELKNYIESKFEPWMNWNNHGKYKLELWNDNDLTTWAWHLDHIIPHSKFKYTSMDDQEFKDCWALSNLRPYSAKQNVIDGNRKYINQTKDLI